MSSYEDDDEPHMLAVGSGLDSIHDEEDVLDPHEEMMMMHANEAVGNNTTPPPPPVQDEEVGHTAFEPPSNTTNNPVDDSFESYIFDSDGDDDFQARGRNHVIPVINSSPTKKKRSSPDGTTPDSNLTDPMSSITSPASSNDASKNISSPTNDDSPPKSPGRLFGRKSQQAGMYISPPSSSEFETSPTSEAMPPPQSAFSSPSNQRNEGLPHFRYSSPVIQTPPAMQPPPRRSSAPVAYTRQNSAPPSYNGQQEGPPPTIPDGRTPIILDTPQGYQQPSASKTKVEQHASSPREGFDSGFIFGMPKCRFFVLSFYLVFITAAFAYFVSQYAQVASLKDQVKKLGAEVDRLEMQVDELELLIADLNATVYDLSREVTDLQVENDKLETQNAILAEANDAFGNQTAELQEQIDILQSTVSNLTLANEALKEEATNLALLNEELANMTVALNETNAELTAQVDNLTAVNEELVESNEALTNQTQELQATLGELVLEFDEAYETVVELQDEAAILREENDRLSNLTENLATILSFLEETNQDADLTVDQLASQLEEQITNNRRLVLENLQNTLTQRTQTWNCDYVSAFSGSDFAADANIAIPSGSYDSVMDYVETRVLTDLCLDRSDFELYLSVNFMPNGDGLTSSELVSGVSMYTSDALDHYFPDSGEGGVTPEEWAEASYDCSNLPGELKYTSSI